jgi:hypothetical protein
VWLRVRAALQPQPAVAVAEQTILPAEQLLGKVRLCAYSHANKRTQPCSVCLSDLRDALSVESLLALCAAYEGNQGDRASCAAALTMVSSRKMPSVYTSTWIGSPVLWTAVHDTQKAA